MTGRNDDGGYLLGIAGSLRRDSYNRALLRAAGEAFPDDVDFRTYEGLAEVPPYNADEEGPPAPAAVDDLRQAIEGARAVLIATPEYNHSVPGLLKNAVDWASRPYRESCLSERLVAVIGASPGRRGAASGQEDLRKSLRAAGATILDVELEVGRVHERFDDELRLVDDGLRTRLAAIAQELLRASGPWRSGLVSSSGWPERRCSRAS